ncbi:MAG: tRNA 4-thiouridine(8) synthase ThiI [Deltaproteobacteria bacterium]|nr:tRNA 4-thiouridine(8) synthase ThiI [Deltaproteobacteria bacterium]
MPDSAAQPRPKTRPRALGLYSGGLDSILAALVLDRAGVAVQLVTFASPFFPPDTARTLARRHGLTHRVVELGPAYIDMVRRPPRGRGRYMNPCVDCHAFMLRQAGGIMEAEGLDFLFTGEVLNQRPMSQTKSSLNAVAKDSGFKERILRPLSARLLPPTPMEESGLVDREKLLALWGRGRKAQMALAKEFGVTDYPPPAGGCLLTEPGFSRRLADLWEHDPAAGGPHLELLKHGRHLRLSPRARLALGRNQADNEGLEQAAPDDAWWLKSLDAPGPLGLYFGPAPSPELELALGLVAGYGKTPAGQPARLEAVGPGGVRLEFTLPALPRERARDLLL